MPQQSNTPRISWKTKSEMIFGCITQLGAFAHRASTIQTLTDCQTVWIFYNESVKLELKFNTNKDETSFVDLLIPPLKLVGQSSVRWLYAPLLGFCQNNQRNFTNLISSSGLYTLQNYYPLVVDIEYAFLPLFQVRYYGYRSDVRNATSEEPNVKDCFAFQTEGE